MRPVSSARGKARNFTETDPPFPRRPQQRLRTDVQKKLQLLPRETLVRLGNYLCDFFFCAGSHISVIVRYVVVFSELLRSHCSRDLCNWLGKGQRSVSMEEFYRGRNVFITGATGFLGKGMHFQLGVGLRC